MKMLKPYGSCGTLDVTAVDMMCVLFINHAWMIFDQRDTFLFIGNETKFFISTLTPSLPLTPSRNQPVSYFKNNCNLVVQLLTLSGNLQKKMMKMQRAFS